MNLDISNADEYLVTAAQIFDYYGADRRGKLRVDELMDKFPSYVKNNQYLKTLLDPDLSNQEISITMLAEALSKYSESQKTRIDLEESFNMKPGPGPQDSDSGISTDGPVLEDLQLELREKSHVARQLRNQLEFNDRQHEEVLATITAERDSLRAHLNMLRDENITLTHVRCDYEEACERLCNSDAALDDARRELDALRRRNALLHEQATGLEADKHTLQELLSKSKGECHRINEMYASRQSALLEQNESLRSQSADLASRLQDMEEVMQQLMSEKVHIEMELKDMLNKSNHTHLRLDRSIDVSYTEEQMLTALDSLNADSRMVTENPFEDESFFQTLKDDQGRFTNMSLFDEIRLSFSNVSKCNPVDMNETPCATALRIIDGVNVETQTENNRGNRMINGVDAETQTVNVRRVRIRDGFIVETQTDNARGYRVKSQTENGKRHCLIDDVNDKGLKIIGGVNVTTQTENSKILRMISGVTVETQTQNPRLRITDIGTQTESEVSNINNNNNNVECNDCRIQCKECEKQAKYTSKLETDLKRAEFAMNAVQQDLEKYEYNLDFLQKTVDDGKVSSRMQQMVVESLTAKLSVLEEALSCEKDQLSRLDCLSCEVSCVQCQTGCDMASVGTQASAPCDACVLRARPPPDTWGRRVWRHLKSLFSVFALLCFCGALLFLYNVSHYHYAARRCLRAPAVPWRWLSVRDLLDVALRIEYVGDVPM